MLSTLVTTGTNLFQPSGSYALTSAITGPSSIYQTITNMSSYITSSTLTSNLSSYAPLSGPTFSGTLAAPIINASSTLQYGGVDTNTIYQPKHWVCCSVSYGKRVLPQITAGSH